MQLKFTINGQHIVRTDFSHVVAESRNYLTCVFCFGSEWNGLVKTAIFQKGEAVFHVVLQEDGIAAERMPVLSAGIWNVSVFGGDRLTTDSVALPVVCSGYAVENVPKAPAVGVYETLTSLIEESMAKTQELETQIVNGGSRVNISGDTLYIGVHTERRGNDE